MEEDDQERSHTAENMASTAGRTTSETFASAGGRPFFDIFPRELRDTIYEYTFEHFVRQNLRDGEDLIFRFRAPVANLRLISRQFTAEYDERLSARKSVLYVVNNSRNISRTWKVSCPRLAIRCKELKTTHALFDGCDEFAVGMYCDVMAKVISHWENTLAIAAALPHLRRVDVIFNCESLRHLPRPEGFSTYMSLLKDVGRLRKLPKEGKYKLCYQGLTYPLPRNLRELDVPNIHILEAPVTLATWTQASKREQIDPEDLKQRLRVEAEVLETWKVVHGCTLWDSQSTLRKLEYRRPAPPKRRLSSFRTILRELLCGLLVRGT